MTLDTCRSCQAAQNGTATGVSASQRTAPPIPGNSVCVVFGFGCPRSKTETARLLPYLQMNGWKLTPRLARADVVIMATCGFCDAMEDESVQMLQDTQRRLKSGARLIVVGCLAGINPALVAKICPSADIVAPTQLARLDDLLHNRIPIASVADVNDYDELIDGSRQSVAQPMRQLARRLAPKGSLGRRISHLANRIKYPEQKPPPGRRVFHIRLSRGCGSECSYCAIRLAIGPLSSRQPQEVLQEFRTGLARGFKNFQLIAADVGEYGRDIGTTFPDLLDAMLSEKGDFQLDLPDLHPNRLIEHRGRMIELLSRRPQRVRFLLVPIQSGSDEILAAMNRGYKSMEAMEMVDQIAKATGRIQLETHVLVGFPGETERHFAETVAALVDAPFTRIVAYAYSDRPGTAASHMPDKIPQEVIEQRIERLRRTFPHKFRW